MKVFIVLSLIVVNAVIMRELPEFLVYLTECSLLGIILGWYIGE